MIMCYKIITNKIDINRDNFFMLNKLSTRGHEFKLRKDQRFRKQPRCQNFSIRCIDDWNSHKLFEQSQQTNLKIYWINIGRMKDTNPHLRRYIPTYSYIHTYIYMYTHVYIYMYTHVYIYMYTHVYYIHVHTRILYTCTHIRIHIYMYTQAYTYTCTHRRIHIHVHTGVYIYMYTQAYIHIYMYTQAYTYTCTHRRIYIYMYTHTYIHTHIHVHIPNTLHIMFIV